MEIDRNSIELLKHLICRGDFLSPPALIEALLPTFDKSRHFSPEIYPEDIVSYSLTGKTAYQWAF